jgi:tetratricopeptide (TPR) repeat protein
MRIFFIVTMLALLISAPAEAQKKKKSKTETLSADEAKDLLGQLKMDSVQFLRDAGHQACKCIDSISVTNKDHDEISDEIHTCIDKQVSTFQISVKLFQSMTGGSKEISIYTDKESDGYRKYYYDIERWLKDSCKAMNDAISSHNKESTNSMSDDPEALKQYNTGVEIMKVENYKKALPYFQKAVEIDPKFAFAWDNVGICQRKLNNLDEAMAAYNKSLEIDPSGHMPLQNIAIVYQYQKKYDKATEAYMQLLKFYPDDAEAYYGVGLVYTYYDVNLEKALQNLCKAYNLYIKANSPFRVDAEKVIGYIYSEMKKAGKEQLFFDILQQHNIKAN